jgi:hypothetical protein
MFEKKVFESLSLSLFNLLHFGFSFVHLPVNIKEEIVKDKRHNDYSLK